jgi:hypothetical protein
VDSTEQEKLFDLFSCFMPSAARRYLALEPNQRFAHYTSATVALSIIRDAQVWMRSTTVMNDHSESKYGLERLRFAWTSPAGEKFRQLIDSTFPKLSNEVAHYFDDATSAIIFDTFATCLSEHDERLDVHGRLSMWRAYGKKNGVALILNNDALKAKSGVLGVYSSPVEYLDDAKFVSSFDEVNKLVEGRLADISLLGRDSLKQWIFQMFRFAVHCTKHPGFEEEREWRVIHTVGVDQPIVESGPKLTREIRDVAGVPQCIYKIPLVSSPEHGLVGLSVPELIHEVIVGPCEYPYAVARALVDALFEAGLQDAAERVRVSNIPLRVNGG